MIALPLCMSIAFPQLSNAADKPFLCVDAANHPDHCKHTDLPEGEPLGGSKTKHGSGEGDAKTPHVRFKNGQVVVIEVEEEKEEIAE